VSGHTDDSKVHVALAFSIGSRNGPKQVIIGPFSDCPVSQVKHLHFKSVSVLIGMLHLPFITLINLNISRLLLAKQDNFTPSSPFRETPPLGKSASPKPRHYRLITDISFANHCQGIDRCWAFQFFAPLSTEIFYQFNLGDR